MNILNACKDMQYNCIVIPHPLPWLARISSIKNLLIMKLFLVLLIATGLQVTAKSSDAQDVTITGTNLSMDKIFREIRKQTNFQFFYKNEFLESARPVNINVQRVPVVQALNRAFDNQPLTYAIIGKTIVIKKVPHTDPSSVEALHPLADISGTIVDSATGRPLVGVTIQIKGGTVGTTTDANGKFQLSADEDATLVVSYLGYSSKEVALGGRTTITISLSSSTSQLNQIVVTALGIRKEVRTLGYSTDEVNHDEVAQNRTNTTLGALQGKVSGVNITSLGTGPQGTTRIRIRGQSSFSGTNTPLIVVDGMPIDNSSYVKGGSFSPRNSLNNSDGGDGLSSINPDDIESMTVLKGAAAAALYGSRAKDGVIMITTKKRGDKKGIGIEYNLNFTTETPLDFTDFQYEYGQGEGGKRPTAPYPTSGIWSFGEKFEPGMTQVLFTGIEVPYKPVYNRVRKFYNIGNDITNTVTLSNSGDNGGFNLSLANTYNRSIVPNSHYDRKTINLGFIQNITKKLSVQGTANYSNEYNKNPAQVGGQEFSTPSSVFTIANSMPFNLLHKFMLDSNGNEFVYARFLPRTNPYYSAYEHFENIKRDRLFGNIAVKYQFNDWLYLQGRIAQDLYTRNQDYNLPTGYAAIGPAPAGFVNGSYIQEVRKFRERNYDFLLGASHTFGKIGVDGTFGGNQMYRRMEYNSVAVQDFIQRGLYTIMNGRAKDPEYALTESKVNSLYGALEFSYQSFLYLNVTGRNDWFSTLAPSSRSIFYPSVTGSFIFTDAIKGMPSWLSFGKLRAAFAQVGDDNVAPYSNALYYQVNNNLFPNPQGQMIPVGGINTSTIPNGDLRPLTITEAEVGFDLKFLNNRIGLDMSFYRKITKNQIISAQISTTSSYSSQLINVGKSMNKGIEMAITATPVTTPTFNWDVNINVTYNTSKVLKLGLNEADSMISLGGIREVVGKPLGQIYEYMYLRDDQGRQVFDPNSGFPMRTPEKVNVGSNQPNYFGGITNSFSYKGISLSFLIDFKLGKDYIVDGGSNRNYWRHGLHKGTLPGRDVGYMIGDGVNPDGKVNTTKAEIQPYYESVTSLGIAEPFIYNAGFWKLRQISLSYDFSRFLSDKFFIKGLRLSVVSNNVAVLKKWTENMDPEEVYGYSDNSSGAGWSSLPITRSIGFNLNVKF